jgi:hypothetical protein
MPSIVGTCSRRMRAAIRPETGRTRRDPQGHTRHRRLPPNIGEHGVECRVDAARVVSPAGNPAFSPGACERFGGIPWLPIAARRISGLFRLALISRSPEMTL